MLFRSGLAYTGSGVAASAIGMDKVLQKRIWRGLGLPVVDWREVTQARWRRDREAVLGELEAFAAGAGDPRLMVKPARLGSSVGMTLAHEAGERAAALEEAFRYDTLADHADAVELQTLAASNRRCLYLLALLLAAFNYVPLVNLVVPALTGLAFTHFQLGALAKLRESPQSALAK